MELNKTEKFAIALLSLYMTIYFFLITSKYALWGSDILYLIKISKNINFHSFLSPQMGYPQGLPLLLSMERKLSNLSPYMGAKVHIALLFTFIVFATLLLSLYLFRSIKIAIISSFIVAGVYPSASPMSPQYGQAVNLAIFLILLSIIVLSMYERKNRLLFMITGFILLSPSVILNRPSIIIVFLIISIYIVLLSITKKKNNITKHTGLINIIIILVISIFFIVVWHIYSSQIQKLLGGPIIVTKEYLSNSQPIPYSRTYFPNYVGWELVPLLIMSFIFLIKRLKRFVPLIMISSIIVILGINIIYILGFGILSISLGTRTSCYSLYIIAIFTPLPLLQIYKKIKSASHQHKFKYIYILYCIVVVSIPLYILDTPIQKYIFRAVTETSPERINIPIIGGKLLPYIIVATTILFLFAIFILIEIIHKNVDRKKWAYTFSRIMPLALVLLILVPRLLLGIGGFYLIPPDVPPQDIPTFEYAYSHFEKYCVLSDPYTTYFAVGYGLHVCLNIGGKIYKDYVPLYGPPDKSGSIISGWSRMVSIWIKRGDVNDIYNFLIQSNISYFMINVYYGKLATYKFNDKGMYIYMPSIMEKLKLTLDQDKRFVNIYSSHPGMYIYEVVK